MPVEEQNYPYTQLRCDSASHSLPQHMDRGLFQNKPAHGAQPRLQRSPREEFTIRVELRQHYWGCRHRHHVPLKPRVSS